MKSLYRLQIIFKENIETYHRLSEILGVSPTNTDFSHFKDNIPSQWSYDVLETEEDPYFDFIERFLDLLGNKYQQLEKLQINRDDISCWFFYAYDGQCNMEFDPARLKRLGENGITLCITCWDTSSGD